MKPCTHAIVDIIIFIYIKICIDKITIYYYLIFDNNLILSTFTYYMIILFIPFYILSINVLTNFDYDQWSMIITKNNYISS